MGYEDPVQLADLLHGLTRRLRHAQAERLAPLGLTPAQERALRMIDLYARQAAEVLEHMGVEPLRRQRLFRAPR